MKKGGVSWKKRYFVLQSEGGGTGSEDPPRIVYYVKAEDKGKKIRGELELNAESRISDLPNKKSEWLLGQGRHAIPRTRGGLEGLTWGTNKGFEDEGGCM